VGARRAAGDPRPAPRQGDLAGPRDDLALAFEARGENLQQGGVGVGTLDVKGDIGAPSQAGRCRRRDGDEADDTGGRYASATAGLRGTLAAHALTLAIVGDDVDANLRFEGGLADGRWRGTLAALRNRGTYQAELAAPARLEFGAGQVELADARLAIAEGSLRVGGLRWERRAPHHRRRVRRHPLSAVAHGRHPLPLRSTLVLGGEWNSPPRRG
jgi:translocation and assembly module TamB